MGKVKFLLLITLITGCASTKYITKSLVTPEFPHLERPVIDLDNLDDDKVSLMRYALNLELQLDSWNKWADEIKN